MARTAAGFLYLIHACIAWIVGGRAAVPRIVIDPLPSPVTSPNKCGRPNVAASQICDPSLLLSKDDKDVIEGLINGMTSAQVAQVAVAIVPSVYRTHGHDEDEVDKDTESYARRLHDAWGVGDKTKNDGVLIFVSVATRSLFISTGDGVKGKLPKRYLQGHVIGEVMKPDLRQKQYGLALQKALMELDAVLSGKLTLPSSYTSTWAVWSDVFYAWLQPAVFVGVFAFFAWTGYTESRRRERGRRALDALIQEVSAGDAHYESKSCPICLEPFVTNTSEKDEEKDKGKEQDHAASDALLTPAAAAAPASSGAEKKENEGGPLRPKKLRCGHLFCHGCLTAYLKSADGTKCPICRAPVDGSSAPSGV